MRAHFPEPLSRSYDRFLAHIAPCSELHKRLQWAFRIATSKGRQLEDRIWVYGCSRNPIDRPQSMSFDVPDLGHGYELQLRKDALAALGRTP